MVALLKKPEQIISVEQTNSYNCGPANVQMILRAFGEFRSQDNLEAQLATTEHRGTTKDSIRRFFWYKGFQTDERAGVGWHELQKLRRETDNPVLVCWLPDPKDNDSHYSLVKEVRRASIILTDTTNGGDLELPRDEWMRAWRDHPMVERQFAEIHWLMEIHRYG